MKTIVFGNLRDAKTGKVPRVRVTNREAKILDATAKRARQAANDFCTRIRPQS